MANSNWSRHFFFPPSAMRPRQRPPPQFQVPPPPPPSHAPHQNRRNGRIAPPRPRSSPHKPPYAVQPRRAMHEQIFEAGTSPIGPRGKPFHQNRPQTQHRQPKPTPPPREPPPQKENRRPQPNPASKLQEQQPQRFPPKPASDEQQTPPQNQQPQQPQEIPQSEQVHPPPPPKTTPKTPPPTPPKANPDPWRIHYLLEKERFSPSDLKPYALHFFQSPSHTSETTTESKFTPSRPISSAYAPDQLFGKAASRKCEVREIPVTFTQIWNRRLVHRRWDAVREDEGGWLAFREQSVRIQIQRHHGHGTLFFVQEGGDEGIMEDGGQAPDVVFRLVDAGGQPFTRVNKWDLQTTFHGVGADEGVLAGIDGKEIKFEIEEGARQVRIEKEGMSKDWEGKVRGDLIVDIV